MADWTHYERMPRARLIERLAFAENRLREVRDSLAKATEERDAAIEMLREAAMLLIEHESWVDSNPYTVDATKKWLERFEGTVGP